MAACAVILHEGEAVRIEDRVGEPSALLADGVVRCVISLGLLPGDLMQDLDDLLSLLEGLVDALGEYSLLIELVGPDDLTLHTEGVHGIQERLDEVMGVVLVLATGAGDPAYGHAHVLLELLRQEIIALAQGIERIDQIYQADLFPFSLDSTTDGLPRDGFPKASYMDDTGRTDSRSDERMLACVRDLLGYNICPVHFNHGAIGPL